MTTYTGQSIKRFEDHRLLTGQSSYVDDMTRPGMLHALIIRSPHGHARIRSIDASAALALTGVTAVIAAQDIADIAVLPTRESADADELNPPRHPALAVDKACYAGQPVAIVLAENIYTAEDAVELVNIDYEILPAVIDPREATSESAPVIHEQFGSNVVLRTVNAGGDLDGAFAGADCVITQRFDVQRVAPAPMEPRGLLAEYDAEADLLTVWDSTQHPHEIREHLARLLDRPLESVRVACPDVGGGFGEKGCFFPEELAIPYLAMKLGRPIKWVESRQENMLCFHGRGHSIDMEAAAQSDGTLLGIRVKVTADLGAYFFMSTPTVPILTSHRLTGPYRTPAMSVEVVGVATNKSVTGAYRGAGGPEAAFCMERAVDLVAQELGLDPADVRRRNFIAPDAFPYETPTGIIYDSGEYAAVFERSLEMSCYREWRERSRQQSEDTGALVGVGIATVVKGSGAKVTFLEEHARCIVGPDGDVEVHTGISPHGQGTETTFAQVVADQLGIAPGDVRVRHSDSAILPAGGGTSASRGVIAGGTVLYNVVQEAREKLITVAGHLLDCPPGDVDLSEGRAVDRNNSSRSVPFAQVAEAAHNEELLPPGEEPGVDFDGTNTLTRSPYAFGSHIAVVEVSRENGAIKILHYTGVHDSGKVINPMLYDGQIHGAIAQGIGQALWEGMVYDSAGQPLSGSLMDYVMPKSIDLPDFDLDSTYETPSPITALGVKGIGELPTLAAPVAIANAVMDALSSAGVKHIDTPLTPEKVWQALKDGGAAS
ncbi:MAG: xanthine dehydrogenase family protein molybdopterin-binding subunit [Chloroflexi bacterium]|nr:xanthine dehydrogenase family protein molybdopterin-binding subunit [Chloroflexota bacterium]MYE41478.1 xanthine dehydrogenase family protein molybdopterin-binding subunit [Chloroflexota bacterium]